MSRNYDNWERLVEAVLKREQYWEMAHAHSRNTSTASSVSLDFDELSFEFAKRKSTDSSKGLDGNGLKSQNSVISSDASQNEGESIKQYEAGVYVTIVAFRDGSREIKRARYRCIINFCIFPIIAYAARGNSRSTKQRLGGQKIEKKFTKNTTFVEYSGFQPPTRLQVGTRGVVSQGNNSKDSGPHQHDENGAKSSNSVGSDKGDVNQAEVEWIEKYEPGVYITLVALQDGSRDIKRARFSRRKFQEHQAETWWSKNREKVYEIYNIRGVDALK
ncbi:BRX domain-containing protein [Abeliophyllum distichum]|uniref:BRX domain-containing protein n=1 Tax=Abeliophyllum distichum TaxID=126358 RepID=A0ABD1VXN3_9LAMI